MVIEKQGVQSNISIIIPAYNEEKYINQCIESIKKINNNNYIIEIVVVDNGSNDDTMKISECLGAKVVLKKDGTIASLRNYGARQAKGNIIIFLDADCMVSNDFVERALLYLNKEDKIILGFRISVPRDSTWVAKCWDLLFMKKYTTGEAEWVPSGNMIMTRKTFESINGFNERLETNEDCDFCFRAREQGNKVLSSTETSVIHLRPPKNLVAVFRKELWHGKEALKLFINDIVKINWHKILKAKNIKPVIYALIYLIFILAIITSIIMYLKYNLLLPIIVSLLCPIILSSILATKYTSSKENHKMIFGMTILLIVYGFSRALSLFLPLKEIYKKNIKI